MREKSGGHAMSGMFVFLLLGLFALFSTVLVLLCAQAYRNTVDQTAMHRDQRIIQSFMRNTLRAEDADNAVGTAKIGDIDALTIVSDFDGDIYVRYLYCYEGTLRDLFIGEEDIFRPEYGEEVCPAASFSADAQDGLVTIEMTDTDGRAYTFWIAQRCAW